MKKILSFVLITIFSLTLFMVKVDAVTQATTIVVGTTYTTEVGQQSASDVTWSSSNAAIATVSNLGVISGVKVGTATITGKATSGLIHTFTVTVVSESTTNPNTAPEWYVYLFGALCLFGMIVIINGYKKNKNLN